MRRCAFSDPALPLVVPRAERKIEGGGDINLRVSGHFEMSGSTLVDSWDVDLTVESSRRAMAWITGWSERVRSVVRI